MIIIKQMFASLILFAQLPLIAMFADTSSDPYDVEIQSCILRHDFEALQRHQTLYRIPFKEHHLQLAREQLAQTQIDMTKSRFFDILKAFGGGAELFVGLIGTSFGGFCFFWPEMVDEHDPDFMQKVAAVVGCLGLAVGYEGVNNLRAVATNRHNKNQYLRAYAIEHLIEKSMR